MPLSLIDAMLDFSLITTLPLLRRRHAAARDFARVPCLSLRHIRRLPLIYAVY